MSKAEVKIIRPKIFISKRRALLLLPVIHGGNQRRGGGAQVTSARRPRSRNNCARELKVIPLPTNNALQSGCHDFRHVFVLQRQV
jgi:hypothetical protein